MSATVANANTTASKSFASPAGWEGEGQLRATSAAHRATVRVLAKTYPHPSETAVAMDCLAREFPGSAGNRMQQFVWFLNSGVSIVESIQRTPDLLQPAHGAALRLAAQTGTFREMCWSLLQRDAGAASQTDMHRSQSISQQLRLLGGFFVAWVILTFFAIFIVPTFQAMFDEFGLALPSPFILLLFVMRALSLVMPLVIMLLMIYVAIRVPLILEALTNRWSPNRGGQRELPAALSMRALLANAAEAERSVVASLGDLSAVHPQPAVRQKLQLASEQAQQGQETWTAIADQGLLSRHESNVLTAAHSQQAQAWLLRWFVAKNLSRRRRWSSLAWRVISFVSMTLLAAIVALAVISVFSVLISLISGLS